MYNRLLVVVDEREASRSAMLQAIEIARIDRAELLLFHVLTPMTMAVPMPAVDFPVFDTGFEEEQTRQARARASQLLQQMSRLAEASGVRHQRAMGEGYDAAGCVVHAAAKRQCNVIVVGADRQNAVMRLLGGSIIPGLITQSPVPVLVVKQSTCEPRRRHRVRALARPSNEGS